MIQIYIYIYLWIHFAWKGLHIWVHIRTYLQMHTTSHEFRMLVKQQHQWLRRRGRSQAWPHTALTTVYFGWAQSGWLLRISMIAGSDRTSMDIHCHIKTSKSQDSEIKPMQVHKWPEAFGKQLSQCADMFRYVHYMCVCCFLLFCADM